MTKQKKELDFEKDKTELLKEINLKGLPLEINSIKTFKNRGYDTKQLFYEDVIGELKKSREIDLLGIKRHEITNPKSELTIRYNEHVIGECKQLNDYGILIYEMEEDLEDFPIRLPYFVNGNNLIHWLPVDFDMMASFQERFDIGHFTQKIQMMNSKPSNKETYIGGNNVIFEASTQLISAVNYYYIQSKEMIYGSTEMFKLSNKTVFEHSITGIKLNGAFIVSTLLPIIITNCPIYKIIMDSEYNVIDYQEIQYCIFNFNPPDMNKYSKMLNSLFTQAIVITNIDNLNNFLIKINDKMITEIKSELNKKLLMEHLIITEIKSWMSQNKDLIKTRTTIY